MAALKRSLAMQKLCDHVHDWQVNSAAYSGCRHCWRGKCEAGEGEQRERCVGNIGYCFHVFFFSLAIQPHVQPALRRLSAMISQYFIHPPAPWLEPSVGFVLPELGPAC